MAFLVNSSFKALFWLMRNAKPFSLAGKAVTLKKEKTLNRPEVLRFLESFFAEPLCHAKCKPFLNLILSLKQDLGVSIPILRELAVLITGKETAERACTNGPLSGRINRIYYRLCRIQEELGRIDFKKAKPGVSPEDFVFSKIDFSRYREIIDKDFELFFLQGLGDYSEDFFLHNFRLGRNGIKSMVQDSYLKTGKTYKLQKETPLILSVIRTLETSLETLPLFTGEEIVTELKNLAAFVNGPKIRGMEKLYPLLVFGLDNVIFTHEDGMTTKLFISGEGELRGTFNPANKPWTRVLILSDNT